MAPRAGIEPATNRLTAGCSTTELPRNEAGCLARPYRQDQHKFFKAFAAFCAAPGAKNEAGGEPGPKALGNGGVSSRKTGA